MASVFANALTNQEMYAALKKAQQDLGGYSSTGQNKWNDMDYVSDVPMNSGLSKYEFYFLTVGQPTTETGIVTGSVSRDLYRQVTELENQGSRIVLTHYSRPLIPKIYPVAMAEKAVKKALQDMEDVKGVSLQYLEALS